VIIWRREASRVQYEWLNESWPVCTQHCDDTSLSDEALKYQERLNETKRALEQLIKRLLKPTEVLAYEAHVQVRIIIQNSLFRLGMFTYTWEIPNIIQIALKKLPAVILYAFYCCFKAGSH
jgi:hypothetical protein